MNSRVKQIYTLLHKIGITGQKEELVIQVTDGRTTHVSELTEEEARKLAHHLQQFINQPQNFKPGNKIRRSIMSMAYIMGIIHRRMSNREKMEAIDRYLAGHPKTGKLKPLASMNIRELQALHYQMEKFMMHQLGKDEISADK